MLTTDSLAAIITAAFSRADDDQFEKGYCGDWACGCVDFLAALGIPAEVLIALDPEDFDEGSFIFSHAMVWVPSMQTAFDWRGAEAHHRWHAHDPKAVWYLSRELSSDLHTDLRTNVCARLVLSWRASPRLAA